MKFVHIVAALLLMPFALVSCNGPEVEKPADPPEAVVEAAAHAFAVGFTDRDLSEFESYFAPADQMTGADETIGAAKTYMASAPDGTNIEIASLTFSETRMNDEGDEAVVPYEAELLITPRGELPSEVQINQDVSLQLFDNHWLIVGADQAEIIGDIPTFDD